MGIASFFASLRGSKTPERAIQQRPSQRHDEAPIQPSPPKRRPAPQARVERGLEKPAAVLPRDWAGDNDDNNDDDGTFVAVKAKRLSRRFSSSRPKSSHGSKNRRSWFGGSPDEDDDIPAVPKLTHAPPQQPGDQPARPKRYSSSRAKSSHGLKNRLSWFGGSPDDDDDVPAVPKPVHVMKKHSRDQLAGPSDKAVADLTRTKEDMHQATSERFSHARTHSKKSKERDDPQPKTARRKSSLHRLSWFSKAEEPTTPEALPPLPPMPVTVKPTDRPATSNLPSDKRRSRSASIKSVNRSNSARQKSRSLWASSNPDDSDLDIPPVPRLDRDAHSRSDSNSERSSLDSTGYARTAGTERRPARGERTDRTRAVSVSSRKSYVPKSAAKSFLASTNGASDEVRKSYRLSFRMDENADLVCLTNEQQIEWAKLMNEEAKFQRTSSPRQPEISADQPSEGNKYSNAQALAALEFGLRS